jgi:tRNA-Thr(GGU) m(6)t(6)A37 methyltransferase TsaA
MTGRDLVGDTSRIELRPVGHVESELVEPSEAPRQGDEGAPEAWLVFDADMREPVAGIEVGAEVLVLTWLHRADRTALAVHPRDDPTRPRLSVFATRSADRPNPIGLHRVRVVERQDLRVRVQPLEAVDGTPILDIKPVLGDVGDR